MNLESVNCPRCPLLAAALVVAVPRPEYVNHGTLSFLFLALVAECIRCSFYFVFAPNTATLQDLRCPSRLSTSYEEW